MSQHVALPQYRMCPRLSIAAQYGPKWCGTGHIHEAQRHQGFSVCWHVPLPQYRMHVPQGSSVCRHVPLPQYRMHVAQGSSVCRHAPLPQYRMHVPQGSSVSRHALPRTPLLGLMYRLHVSASHGGGDGSWPYAALGCRTSHAGSDEDPASIAYMP